MGAGTIAAGIVLIVFGVLFFIGSLYLINIQSSNVEECNSLLGELGQRLDSHSYQTCQDILLGHSITKAAQPVGGLFFILGVILLIINPFYGKHEKKIDVSKHTENTIASIESAKDQNLESSNDNEIMYCRYCGKSRPIEGEFCSRCGKSSVSTSISMKTCIICQSILGEDSLFCSRCGTQF